MIFRGKLAILIIYYVQIKEEKPPQNVKSRFFNRKILNNLSYKGRKRLPIITRKFRGVFRGRYRILGHNRGIRR